MFQPDFLDLMHVTERAYLSLDRVVIDEVALGRGDKPRSAHTL
jgi:hypothetical protein